MHILLILFLICQTHCIVIAPSNLPKIDSSVKAINNRYASNQSYKYLISHFNGISNQNSVRGAFFACISRYTKVDTIILMFESSSESETYGYYGIA